MAGCKRGGSCRRPPHPFNGGRAGGLAGSGPLQLNWSSDHTGWRLQAQTNVWNTGLGTHWVDVPNSNQTNRFFVPIMATNGSVFYRLVYP